ncbi:MAG: TRAP transporter small permease subunit [Candidatus Krumholzibacteriota bacterium]|nr:TRAP transporter small permease subunit [Candidatus Krumholzibacteriota bacterium]
METSSLLYLGLFAALTALAFLRSRVDDSVPWRRFYDFFGSLELTLIVSLLGTLVVIGVLQIILRNALHSGLLWADPLMRHIVLWLGALGASLATARLRHINIDVFTRVIPDRFRPLRRVVIYTVTAVAAFMLGVSALQLVAVEKEYAEVAFLGLKTWTLQAVLPFAFFLICYRSLVNLFLGREEELTPGEVKT